MRRLPFLAVSLLFLAHTAALSAPPAKDEGLTFEKHVRPILKAYCLECHGEGEKLRGGLDLRLRRLIVQGGDSGPAIEPGRPADSLLHQRIDEGSMPPGKKKLSRDEVALIGRWISDGARTAGNEPKEIGTGFHITAQERAFWSFQPIRRPALPQVKRMDLVRAPIDAFLLARLEEKGLSFAPEADRATLIRRAAFDLLGLPPTPEEVSRFLADDRPGAYERLIDRLLDSPHYGERWGRHWLDVAGYADSDGASSQDPVRPWAYKYRDYVVRSFNADKPFDLFIQEQLAGDEMQGPGQDRDAAAVERLTATGFLRMAPDGTGINRGDAAAQNQVIAETLKIVSSSLLGLTLGCAQCHNHRYDPIPQSDYYRLRALFEPAYNPKDWRAPPQRLISLYTDADRARAAAIEVEAARIDQERLKKQEEYIDRTVSKELAKLPVEIRDTVRIARETPAAKQTPQQKQLLREHPSVNVSAGSLYLYDQKAADDLKSYADRAARVRATKPVEEFVMALTDGPGPAPPTHLFHRGNHDEPKGVVAPGGLTILEASLPLGVPQKAPSPATTGRRLALARWLTDPRNPLTARVLVNRFWLHHFGRGLVGTPADLGQLGERPTHPELLDWLADEFKAGGWRLKRLHRMMMTSTAYRQSARRDPSKEATDPDNRLLGRMPVRRLEAEALRDAMLAVSGRLNVRFFGKPVPVRLDEVGQVVVGIDTTDSAGRPTGKVIPLLGEEYRRSIYVQVRRSRTLAMAEAFDAPSLEPNCDRRNSSTVATQALLLMNNEFLLEQARAFAERVRQEAGAQPRAQVTRAWRLAYAAEPAPKDVEQAVQFLSEQARHFSSRPQEEALASFCQALLGSNRFLYVD
jgi:hypothetical protein